MSATPLTMAIGLLGEGMNKNTSAHRMNQDEIAGLWSGWHQGLPHHQIAKLVGIKPSSVFEFLAKYGGIEPRARKRRVGSLSQEEREEISRELACGTSLQQIARDLNRSPSTISREVKRNGGADEYRAEHAEYRASECAKRPKLCKLALNGRLRQRVASKLKIEWAPQQISGWLKDEYPDNEKMNVSHETIYKSLFIQSRGVLNKQLRDHLRTKRRYRQSRLKTLKGKVGGSIVDLVSISERPAEVEDRAVPGHWEGDLVAGDQSSFIVTLVERHSRFVMLGRIKNKETSIVVQALINRMSTLPAALQKSVTWDRGSEMSGHKRFSMATDIDVYFCDPYSPWQRGSNENTNGLIRQYLPKGQSVKDVTQAQLNAIANKLNTRPRKTLDYKTPEYVLSQVLR